MTPLSLLPYRSPLTAPRLRSPFTVSRQLQNGHVAIGKDADVRGNLHGALDDVAGRMAGLREHGAGRGQREVPPRSDGNDAVVRLDQLARPAQQETVFQIGYDEQGFQAAQDPVA